MTTSEKVGEAVLKAWGKFQRGDIGWVQFTQATTDALRAATPPAPEAEAGEKVTITPGVYETNNSAWPMAFVFGKNESGHATGVMPASSTLGLSGEYQSCVIWSDGQVWSDGSRVASTVRRISDLPHARPEKPSPSPTALAAAEEIARLLQSHDAHPVPDAYAAIIHAEYEAMERVVEELVRSIENQDYPEGCGHSIDVQAALNRYHALSATEGVSGG